MNFDNILSKITEFLQNNIMGFLMSILFIAVVIILTILAVKLCKRFFKNLTKRLNEMNSPYVTVAGFFKYAAIGAIYFVGGVIIITNIPSLESSLTSLLAGSGIAAIVLGLASQEAMGNIVGGMMVLLFKPFVIGDFIRFVGQDILGTVEEITFRHTTIRTVENKRIMVPNGIINGEIIENANYQDDKTCALVDIGISYNSDIDKAMSIMQKLALAHENFLDNRTDEEKEKDIPPVIVRVMGLADSSVNLRAFVWTENNAAAFVLKCDLLKSIKESFDVNDIEIPYPHVKIITEKAN